MSSYSMFRHILIFVFVILFFVFCSNAYARQSEQESAIAGFYKTILTFKEGGIPSRKNIDRLSPFISADFRKLMLSARGAEDRYSKKKKGSVPPLFEGGLFYSLFEGADKYTSIKAEQDKEQVSYLVDLEYVNPYGKNEKVKWQDRVFLVKENNRWVVHDLELLGKWQFGAKGKVSNILKEIIKDGRQYGN